MPLSKERKVEYFQQLTSLLENYSKMFMVVADNVGSKQMQQIRVSLRGKATLIMGKNTMMRKCINEYLGNNPGHPYGQLLPHISGNVGFCFIEETSSLEEVREIIASNRVPAPARVGAVAPVDVFVEPGPTGCDPGQTAWFQALNIPTKIVKGQIEMVSRMHLVKVGEKVTDSAAALLQKLNLSPFSYALTVTGVFDAGSFFDVKVLDLSDSDVADKFMLGVRNVASISLAIGYPTLASLPHSLNNALKKLLAVAVTTEYTFPKAEPVKAYLADPSAFAVAAPTEAAAEEEATKEESEEEESSEEGGMGGLFGDDEEEDW